MSEWKLIVVCVVLACTSGRAEAQDSASEEPASEEMPPAPATDAPSEPGAEEGDAAHSLANQLANPIANLISIPLQSNFDFGMGERDDGFRYLLNVQPVIPISLGGGWSLINRVIMPFVYQDDVVTAQDTGGDSIAGMSDITASVFLTPPAIGGLMLGVGPVAVLPTSTDDRLGPGHFGAGPTAVAIWQSHGVTAGALVNHVWATTDEPDDYRQTFLQPFVSYVLPTATTLTVQTETTYEWHSDVWTVPLIGGVSQLVHVGPLPMSFGVLGKWYVEGPESAPDWGLRAVVTALLPTGAN